MNDSQKLVKQGLCKKIDFQSARLPVRWFPQNSIWVGLSVHWLCTLSLALTRDTGADERCRTEMSARYSTTQSSIFTVRMTILLDRFRISFKRKLIGTVREDGICSSDANSRCKLLPHQFPGGYMPAAVLGFITMFR